MLDDNINMNKKELKINKKINSLKLENKLKKNRIYYLSNDTIIEEQNNTTKGKIEDDINESEDKDIFTKINCESEHKHSIEGVKNEKYSIDFDEINNLIKTRVLRSFSNKINKKKNMIFNKDNCNLNIQLNFNFNNINIINSNHSEEKICDNMELK